ncbi:MAG: hypothetical protein HW421_428 [Ignavibacteria bacterium]|nr:hypothetical protein [Ignavibacteria bacterium]
MKTKTEFINNHEITIIQEPSIDLNDDIADEIEIDLSSIRRNPYIKNQNKRTIELEPDIAQYFKNSKQVNKFLRKHIKEIELEIFD